MMLRLGARGDAVREMQAALNRLGASLEEDGRFGELTLEAAKTFVDARTKDGVPDWLLAQILAEAASAPRPRSGIETVGAWAGSASLADPERDVAFAASTNVRRLDIVVNDHSKWRTEKAFTLRSRDRIARLVEVARAYGVEPHLMSWIMPYASYIEAAAASLVPLCNELGVASLQWDAEEPWTQAKHALTRADAATRLAYAFAGLRCPMGVTGIGYANAARLGPLASVCAYVVPQAYSTTSSGQKPEVAPMKFHKRWTDLFGRPIVLGLAAYRQSGIPGHSVESAMRAAATAAVSTGVSTVVYWNLAAIRKSKTVADVIRGIAG